MDYIRFRIRGGDKRSDGSVQRASISHMEVSRAFADKSDLPLVMHALSRLTTAVRENNGFPYTLDFELS